MTKRNLMEGIFFLLAGILCLMLAFFTESRLDGILWGFSGAGIGPGLAMICKYFYWSSPRNCARYQEKLELEKIEMQDELKERIRDKSGRHAYQLGLIVICGSILIFSILGSLELLSGTRIIVLYLACYLIFQIAAGVIFFNRILKKY